MESQLRLSLSARTVSPPPAHSKGAATAIVIAEEDLKILFIQRSNHPRDPWANQMALPGGRKEPEDIDLHATAIRETLEEVGLDLTTAESWGPLASVQARSKVGPSDLWVTPYVYRIRGPAPALLLNPEEAQAAVWIPVAHLLQPGSRTVYPLRRENMVMDLPAWAFGKYTIWGMTYFMVNDLLQPLTMKHAPASPWA